MATWRATAAAEVPQGVVPDSVLLSDVEVQLRRESHGGCVGPCVGYRIVIRGAGTVEYEDLEGSSSDGIRRRTITGGEVSALVDEFLRARFFEARNEYEEQWSAAAEGDSLRIRRLRGVDGATWDLSLRLGAWSKTVRLYLGYPGDLAALRDRIEEIAGPQSWPAR